LYAVDNLLMRYLPNECGTPKESLLVPATEELAGHKQGKLYVLLILFAALLIASLMVPKWPASSRSVSPVISLPEELGEWKLIGDPPVQYRFLGSVRYSSTLYRDYLRSNEPVSVFIGTDDRLRRNRSLLSNKNAYQGEIGLEQERSIVDLGPEVGQAVAIVTDHGTERWLSYYWYEGVESVAREVLYAWLALDQSPFRRDEAARVTRLTTFVEFTPEGRMQADKRLRAFLREMQSSR
jgi:hypothetical protein